MDTCTDAREHGHTDNRAETQRKPPNKRAHTQHGANTPIHHPVTILSCLPGEQVHSFVMVVEISDGLWLVINDGITEGLGLAAGGTRLLL